jgi:hypothetical protein
VPGIRLFFLTKQKDLRIMSERDAPPWLPATPYFNSTSLKEDYHVNYTNAQLTVRLVGFSTHRNIHY